MKKVNLLWVLIFFASIFFSNEALSLDRMMDQVVIQGSDFERTKSRPISGLRLMSFSSNGLIVIPFQIDERKPDGDYVMTRMDGTVDRDTDNGLFDDNDELVFMARDSGARGDPASSGIAPSAWDEIIIRDPDTGERGFAYLAAFDREPPEPSSVKYMRYIQNFDHDKMITPYYTLCFPKNDVFLSDLMIHEPAGGNGKDIMDKIKMRTGVELLGGFITMNRTEEDFVHEVLGVIQGPVRVIRQTSTRLVILLNLKSPSAVVNGSFYPCCFQFPSMLSLPFRMDLVASDVYMQQGWDLNRNALGLKCYSNLNDEPVTFDGRMSPEELDLAGNRDTLHWMLCTGVQGTFMFYGLWDMGAPIKAILYYEDDLTRLDPPENDPGVMSFAYKLMNLLEMGGKEYPFNIINYVVPEYDGDLDRALRVYKHPLEFKVNQ